MPIRSTNRGYYMDAPSGFRRTLKCRHRDDEITEELNRVVDLGATVEDVFVEHRYYGKIAATMNIQSRKDVNHFMDDIYHSVSTPLNNITNGYHFHTVFAKDEETLNEVEAALDEANVKRFGDYLNRFDKSSQFIVVTHRKGTMSAADSIYGVTMQESGVSKIVSVKLKDLDLD